MLISASKIRFNQLILVRSWLKSFDYLYGPFYLFIFVHNNGRTSQIISLIRFHTRSFDYFLVDVIRFAAHQRVMNAYRQGALYNKAGGTKCIISNDFYVLVVLLGLSHDQYGVFRRTHSKPVGQDYDPF